MNERKWTPGPWQRSLSKESGGSFVEHIDSNYVSHCVAFVHASHGMFEAPKTTEEDEANANLVAAAPDLYEALENARTWVDGCGSQAGLQKVLDEIDAALAKARGAKDAIKDRREAIASIERAIRIEEERT